MYTVLSHSSITFVFISILLGTKRKYSCRHLLYFHSKSQIATLRFHSIASQALSKSKVLNSLELRKRYVRTTNLVKFFDIYIAKGSITILHHGENISDKNQYRTTPTYSLTSTLDSIDVLQY
jgi:protease II